MPDDNIQALITQLTINQARMDEQIKTLFKQQTEIKTLTETVQSLAMSIDRQGQSLKATTEKVDSVKADVDEIKSKPAKRWDSIVTLIITALAGAAIGFFLTKLGIK